MNFALIFISPEKNHSFAEIIKKIMDLLKLPSNIYPLTWLSEQECAEIYLDKAISSLKLKEASLKFQLDLIQIPLQARKKKMLFADMDSTIVTCETLDLVAKYFGLGKKISAITELAMNGELDFNEAFEKRINLLKGKNQDDFSKITDQILPTKGAEELIETMNNNGGITVLVSGGLTFFVGKIAENLNFNHFYGNKIESDNGLITGKVYYPIIDASQKRDILIQLKKEHNISDSQTIAVGDGANDILMLKEAALGVSYHGKDILEREIPVNIRFSDLTALLYIQGYKKVGKKFV